jgi:hypothetical protein
VIINLGTIEFYVSSGCSLVAEKKGYDELLNTAGSYVKQGLPHHVIYFGRSGRS